MNPEQEILEAKAKIRMLELKMQALINILNKEGTILDEELKAEIDALLQGKPGDEEI
jgi:hypothetical protein